MFPVNLTVTILLDDNTTLTVERDFDLPFAPFPGLRIEDNTKPAIMPRVEDVYWDLGTRSFIVIGEEERVAGDRQEVIENLQSEGWTVQEAS